jgi:long-chain acyl-CoA synthetase
MTEASVAQPLGLERPWFAHYEEGIPRRLQYPDIALDGFLSRSAGTYPDRDAIVFYGARLSYRALDDAVNRFASGLVAGGLAKGDRVAILFPNCPQMVIAYYGTLRAGGVAVSISPLSSANELKYQLNDSGARAIVTLSKFYPLVTDVAPRTGCRRIIVTNIKEYFPPLLRLLFTLFKERREGHRLPAAARAGIESFAALLASAPPGPLASRTGPDDPALLQYTGGTTGTPKAAVLTHRNLVANTLQTGAWLVKSEGGTERFLGAIPFFHVYGMTVVMNVCISLGHTMVLLPQFKVKEVLEAVARYRPTIFPGVPAMYVAITNFPGVGGYDLRSIKACLSGAAPLPVQVQARFEELTGARLVEGYGLTEASPVTHANPLYGRRKAGMIGIPLPDTDAKVVDLEAGERTLPPNEIGEIVVKGLQVMQGYWNRPDETAQVLKDGWLHTGDIGYMDEEGFFAVVDRKKDLINVAGFKVYPREVEEPLYEHPKVQEAVAVGLPDPYRGETVKVYIVLKEGQSATAEEVIEYCRTRMAKYKVPTAVAFTNALPKTMVGKVLRRMLRDKEVAGATGGGPA